MKFSIIFTPSLIKSTDKTNRRSFTEINLRMKEIVWSNYEPITLIITYDKIDIVSWAKDPTPACTNLADKS